MSSIRFGLIGCGGRAGSLVNTLMHDKEKHGDLIALCDIRQEAIDHDEKLVQANLKHGTKNYVDYRELLANKDVDAVIIATPDNLHHEMAVAAFKAKKHVFCEKPVGINLNQTMEILKAAKSSGKTLEVGYVLRYAPFYVEMKRMIEAGEIGTPYFGQCLEEYYGAVHFFRRNAWWSQRSCVGGVMIQKICHDMDLHYWMFGKPKQVVAFESRMEFKPENWNTKAQFCKDCPPENRCPYYDPIDSRDRTGGCVYNTNADIADNCQVLIQFESGMNLSMGVNFFNSRGQDDRHWRVVGSKAEITGRLASGLIRFDPRHDESKSTFLECNIPGGAGHGGGDQVQLVEFMKAINEKREAKAGLESAYWSSIIVMGAQISADTKQVVQIKDLTTKYPFPK